MIKFFRKIRKRLLSENRLGKYLLYALGEIILVVIGILIALQVNNRNEYKNDKAKFISLLQEMAVDLAAEIEDSEGVLNTYFTKDSLIALNLVNKLEAEDFQTYCNGCPRYLLINYAQVPINSIAYDQIKGIIDRIPQEYDPLVSEIKQLYEVEVKEVLRRQNSMQQKSSNFREFLIEEYPWYRQMPYLRLSPEAIDYFQNDPIYKNRLMNFSSSGKKYWTQLNQFRGRAIHVLYLLSSIKEVNLEETIGEKPYLLDNDASRKHEGRYKIPAMDDVEFSIYKGTSKLYINMFAEGNEELVPVNDSMFNYTSRFIKFKLVENAYTIYASDGAEIPFEKVE